MTKVFDGQKKIDANRVNLIGMLKNQNFHTIKLTEFPNNAKSYVHFLKNN